MAKKRKPTKPTEWTPFQKCQPNTNERARAVDPTAFDAMMQEYVDGFCVLYANSKFHVHVRFLSGAGNHAGALHLSIRHNDRRPVRDWRQFQRIKNELAGEEREAIEIYPAESRLVDEANSYHLWVLPEGEMLQAGWHVGRMVMTSAEASQAGARQRDTLMPISTPTQPEGDSTR
jgi:hypothetical protein